MKRTVTNLFIMFCAALGVVVSLVLTYKHYRPELDIGCGFERSGCTGILNSSYGAIGPVPTALIGLGMYLVFLVLTRLRGKALAQLRTAEAQQARAYASSGLETPLGEEAGEVPPSVAPAAPVIDTASAPRATVKQTDRLIWGLALCAFGVSWWLQYKALFVLQGFCPWCFTSAILVTLIFLCASWDFLIDGRELTGEHKLLGAVSAFIFVLLAFMYGPTIRDQYQMNKGNGIVSTPLVPKPLTKELVFPPNTHVKGNPKAPVTIVEFADYECPTCGRAVEMLDKALADHPNQLQLGFRNMPLPGIPDHKWNKEAAAAAEAAGLQGKFWEMHDLLFKRQEQQLPKNNFLPAQYDDWAKELNLDVEKFRFSRESEAIKKRVQKDAQDGSDTGLQGTPTYFIIRGDEITKIGNTKKMKARLDDPNDTIWKAK